MKDSLIQEFYMKQKIEVVPPEQSQLEDILRIYYEGFSGKLAFITRNQELQHSFARDFNLINIESADRDFVALINNKVMGILSLRSLKQSDDHTPQKPGLWSLLYKYGFMTLIRAWLFDLVFRHKYEEGELYIDTVAVATDARGTGIGTILLDFTENYAKEKGFKKLSLMVIFENPKAQALYERQGFKVVKKHSLRLLKRSTGVSGAYFMVKEI